jgi:phosphatidylinositol glycan class T
MVAGWGTILSLALSLALSVKGMAGSREQFDESLTIRPLRDGKVASTFSFKTLLKDTPRNPESLDGEDDCTWSYQCWYNIR